MPQPALPPDAEVIAEAALLLDFDGTLIDIAARPDGIRVPPELPALMAGLRAALSNALAVVTGRALADLDRHLAPIRLAAAAEHGAVLRLAPGGNGVRVVRTAPPDAWRDMAAAQAARHPGVVIEHKGGGFVLHYRGAPDAGARLLAFLRSLIAGDARFEVMPALLAWELRARGTDKGTAVRALMAHPTFAGRRPLFIGDDATDWHGIVAARALGGWGFHVAEQFSDAAGVRAWLAALLAAVPVPMFAQEGSCRAL